ncbi:hypothetical protein BDL97_12G086200 [Sphagnum fallax]|nr:hypothetical protein BDL97_12G086200 [Sphagnum fallax]KAH8946279.1 hypothetical protein BDL97_12G086200 [Sphagnum fallax]
MRGNSHGASGSFFSLIDADEFASFLFVSFLRDSSFDASVKDVNRWRLLLISIFCVCLESL